MPETSQIKDFPWVEGLGQKQTRQLYCLLLCIRLSFKPSAPYRLYVTDFTKNQYIANPRLEVPNMFDDLELDSDEIFQVDIYGEHLQPLLKQYQEHARHKLFESRESVVRLLEKFCIIKFDAHLKLFCGVLEARGSNLQLLDKDYGQRPPELIHLYQKIKTSRPAKSHKNKLKTVIPEDILMGSNNGSSGPSPTVETVNKPETRPAPSRPAPAPAPAPPTTLHSIGSNTNLSQPVYQSQPPLKYEELFENDIIPDTNFNDDYVSIPDEDDDALSEDDQIQFRQDNTLSIKHISSMSLVEDGILYETTGYIASIIPCDYSHICVKRFEYNPDTRSAEVSDPFLKPIEIIISSIIPNKELLLTRENSVKLYLDTKQLCQLFPQQIESLYTNPKTFGDIFESLMLHKRKLKVYKKSIKLNNDKKIVVWTCKNNPLVDNQ